MGEEFNQVSAPASAGSKIWLKVIIGAVVVSFVIISILFFVFKSEKIKITDYGYDIDGFIKAASVCEPSIANYELSLDFFGANMTIKYKFNDKGMENGSCIFETVITNYTISYPRGTEEATINIGKTMSQQYIGYNITCRYPPKLLAAKLSGLKAGSFEISTEEDNKYCDQKWTTLEISQNDYQRANNITEQEESQETTEESNAQINECEYDQNCTNKCGSCVLGKEICIVRGSTIGSTKMCVECYSNTDCINGTTCKNDKCISEEDLYKCYQSPCSTCSSGLEMFVKKIGVDGGILSACMNCKTDSDCKPGYTCNVEGFMNRCVNNTEITNHTEIPSQCVENKDCALTCENCISGKQSCIPIFGENKCVECGMFNQNLCKQGYECDLQTSTCRQYIPSDKELACGKCDYCLKGWKESVVGNCEDCSFNNDCLIGYSCQSHICVLG